MSSLRAVPLAQIDPRNGLTIGLQIPDGEAWHRVTRLWGEPKYALVLLLPDVHTLACFRDSEITVEVKNEGIVIPLTSMEYPLYGYSALCPHPGIGREFIAKPAQQVTIILKLTKEATARGYLLIAADWGPNLKDKLLGL